MIDNFLTTLLNKINVDNSYNKTELNEMKYTIKSLLSDFSKLMLFIVLSILLNYEKEFLYAFLTTTLLRVVAGGFHFKSYWSCLLFSAIYYISIISLSCYELSEYTLFLCYFAFSLLLILIAPVLTTQRASANKNKKSIVKIIVLLLIMIYLLMYIIKKDPLFSIGLWTIILQTIQLIIMKGVSIYEKSNKKPIRTQSL